MFNFSILLEVNIFCLHFRDLNKFQEGIGEKIGMCVFFLTIFSANIVNAFVHGWQLTFVMIAPMPVSTINKLNIFCLCLILKTEVYCFIIKPSIFVASRSIDVSHRQISNAFDRERICSIWKSWSYRRRSTKLNTNCCCFRRSEKRG